MHLEVFLLKICTIGLGYIGLPTSITFANFGVEVVGVDVRQDIIDLLNNGYIHIEEPGLQDALESAIKRGNFRASLQPELADAFIIAVPTPNKNDEYKSCDLTYLLSAIESVLPYLNKGNVLIVESTIAPRTMDDFVKPLVEEAGFTIGEDIFLVHCPERVLPGQILHEMIHNNRIVGGITPKCAEEGARIYGVFVKGEIVKTEAKTAEMSKLMENTFRDVNIALANELSRVCNVLEINALEVIEMANKHPRVNLHNPGPGVGGHCLAVDPYFIVAKVPEVTKIINLSRATNSSMPYHIVDSVKLLLEKVNGNVVTLFGLTYKGNVDDIRESPAMEIKSILEQMNKYQVRSFDPHVKKDFVIEDLREAVIGSDLLLILSDHNEFKELNYEILNLMRNKQIFDTRNILKTRHEDFDYINLGNLFNYIKTKEYAKL
jgi:UDP-N-acetyl-D-mannosaminuronic acid dehydrogenase